MFDPLGRNQVKCPPACRRAWPGKASGCELLRIAALLLASTCPLVAQPTVTVPLNGHNFTLPTGFTIEVAAKSPLVERPVTISFDEIGHLYVADSSGSNEKLTIQLEKKPHRIVRLDPAKDGVFTKGHVFADKMMFPEGTMWHKGSLYVAAPPSIWKLTDTTGNGVADQRVEWYQGKTLTNCGNDLHGPWLGPDGWFYWTRGGFAPQKHVFAGKEIETRASILFRAKPDGSQREPIMVGGMDNPVGLAFTPGGEPIVTNTFLVYPANGQRDGLIHAVCGGVYGKDFTDVLAPHFRTSTKLMPVMEHLGPAAPTGIVRYDSDVFGKEYQDNMFVGQFNLRKVSRHILTPKGATFESKTTDFVVSDNHRFPSDRRRHGRGRQSLDRRHRRLVQALLPDVAAREAGRARSDLPSAEGRGEGAGRSTRGEDRLGGGDVD